MNRPGAALGSLAFLVLGPGTVAGVVPWWISRWQVRPALLGLGAGRVLGGVLLAAACGVLLDSFARFALRGVGTPAPVLPTRHLVASGLYRHVRNPMYVAVVSAVLGQALLLGDARLLAYGGALLAVFHAFVVGYEEPTLRRTHGAEYERFRENVPRWIPRLTPWRGGEAPLTDPPA